MLTYIKCLRLLNMDEMQQVLFLCDSQRVHNTETVVVQ